MIKLPLHGETERSVAIRLLIKRWVEKNRQSTVEEPAEARLQETKLKFNYQ